MAVRTHMKLRPAVKWYGGKHYLAGRILSLFLNHHRYCEPYCGGLSVLLRKWWTPIEVAGDLNGPLIEFYECLQSRSEELISRLQSIAYTRESFARACQAREESDPIERAVRFLVRNRFSRGGLGRDFAWSDRLRGGQPGDVNGWKTILKELPAIAKRLQGVQLYHAHALDLIERFDSPETLHYLDPPYLSATRTAKDAYAHEMSDAEHMRLLDTILNVRGMVVVSGYASALYDTALRSWERIEIEIANNAGQTKVKQRRTEVLWVNPGHDKLELRG
jgi:DNA adenine methylase